MTSLRSPSRTVSRASSRPSSRASSGTSSAVASATSGPGRAPGSDGRARRRHARRVRRGHVSAEAVRLRAESLFAEPQPPPASPRPEVSAASPRLDVAAADAPLLPGREGGGAERPAPPAPGWARQEDAAAETWAEADGAAKGAALDGPSRRERMGLAVRERLPVWLQSRCGVDRRGVVALVVVLAVAAVFAAQHFWTGRTQPVQAPDVVRAAGAAAERGARPAPSPGPSVEAGRAAAGGSGAAGAAGSGGGAIVVDVSGKVRRPGVHRLPAGSRVADALRAAGGARPGADMGGLNRARFLTDGEQVVVGEPAAAPAPGGSGAATGAGSAGAGAAGATGPVGLNTATAEQLDELPGVGPVLAQHIIDYRTEHGGFRSVEELREVNGIGDRRYADLQGLVRP
ncbi:DNA-binding protein [Streptomyces sp. WAC 01529]|uniref:ComEA family DNA-binding protein n=1 Tax=Streptomyces sp. WAC 01529 TaxID=2203205 RepID=UPI000F6E6A98|nr:ComEA family DNA-binding protein [Streptomyces sp. WAC 01529]AZM57605.1 DNA-binding protein [Streptomyces sp. WAC 01529]